MPFFQPCSLRCFSISLFCCLMDCLAVGRAAAFFNCSCFNVSKLILEAFILIRPVSLSSENCPFSCSHMERRISFLGLPAFWQPHDLQKYKKSGKWENVSQKSDEEWTCFDNYCVILWPIKIYLRN